MGPSKRHMRSLINKATNSNAFSCDKKSTVEAMLEDIKVRTLEDNRTMFTIAIDATKVAKVMTMNLKHERIVEAKHPCHVIATLNLSNDQIDDIYKQTEAALIKT